MNNQTEEAKGKIVFVDLPEEIERGTIGGMFFFNTRYYELIKVGVNKGNLKSNLGGNINVGK